jgi:hypothetical protein
VEDNTVTEGEVARVICALVNAPRRDAITSDPGDDVPVPGLGLLHPQLFEEVRALLCEIAANVASPDPNRWGRTVRALKGIRTEWEVDSRRTQVLRAIERHGERWRSGEDGEHAVEFFRSALTGEGHEFERLADADLVAALSRKPGQTISVAATLSRKAGAFGDAERSQDAAKRAYSMSLKRRGDGQE